MAIDYIDAFNTDEESEDDQRDCEFQEDDMRHAAELYVLISKKNYIYA